VPRSANGIGLARIGRHGLVVSSRSCPDRQTPAGLHPRGSRDCLWRAQRLGSAARESAALDRTGGLGRTRHCGISDVTPIKTRPPAEKLKARWKRLTEYRWSSCRAYLGLEAAPDWLEVDRVRRELGGRSRKAQVDNYGRALRELIGEGDHMLRIRDMTRMALT